MAYLYSEGVIYAEYQLAASNSASTAIPIVFDDNGAYGRVILESEGADIVFLFSNTSGQTANASADSTTKRLVGQNFSITNSVIITTNVAKPTQTGSNVANTLWLSVVTPTGSGTAKVKLVRV